MRTLFDDDDRATILARIDRLTADAAPRWGRMNAAQVLCHLADGVRISLGEIEAARTATLMSRWILRHFALRGFPPPKGRIRAMREIDPQIDGTQPTDFEVDRAQLRRLVAEFATRRSQRDWPEHPLFGPMNAKLWGRMGYSHLDHHLRQFGV